jgi:ferrous iron transport protein A
MKTTLSVLPLGSQAIIEEFTGDESVRERLVDLGFVRGARVESRLRSPLGGATIYRVDNTTVVLRDEEAACVTISPLAQSAVNQ